MTGPLALVGGDEFNPGNEPTDEVLAAAALAAHRGPAYVVPTAAARGGAPKAVAHAQRWFSRFGLQLQELHVLTRAHANNEAVAAQAAGGGFFYLVGGDPGHTAETLRGSLVWQAMAAAWTDGAVLAGSSAGAMALAEWTLIRARFPNHTERAYRPALAAVPRTAVLPHFNTFGHKWVESARAAAPVPDVILLGIDERSGTVWDGSGWRAYGPGPTTLVRADGMAVYQPGSPVPLPVPGAR
ncbi:MAG: hypothetical protein NVS9B1_05140 [Candidatus Dormibacteraceae bacterium]